MIRYDLACDQGHDFDSWFASSAAFDKLAAAGLTACPTCGSTRIEKRLMAPAVGKTTRVEKPLTAPRNEAETALQELRRQVEQNSEYVGNSFATEARAMHEGRAPERAIYGEAKPEEARALIEDGLPVVPLPFRVGNKSN